MKYTHRCELCGRVVVSTKSLFACFCYLAYDPSPLWLELHRYRMEVWDPTTAAQWFSLWLERVPSFGCDCQANFKTYREANPPDFSSEWAFFVWGWQAHNYVSANHVNPPKSPITLLAAMRLHSYGTRARGGA